MGGRLLKLVGGWPPKTGGIEVETSVTHPSRVFLGLQPCHVLRCFYVNSKCSQISRLHRMYNVSMYSSK